MRKWTFVNLSGTAIIKILLPSQTFRFGTVFCVISGASQIFSPVRQQKKQINSKGEQNNDEKKNDGSSINDGDDNSDGSRMLRLL